MSQPYYLQPVYKIEFVSRNDPDVIVHGFGDGYENQVSNWNIKMGMTKSVASFEIDIPDTGSDSSRMCLGNAFYDIDVYDYVKIWYGYTGSGATFQTAPMFIGRVDTKKVELSENGYIRTFTGRDLGEIFFRTLMRRAFTGSAEVSFKEILLQAGIQTNNQPHISTAEIQDQYVVTANGTAFDALSQIADLDGDDFYIDSGSVTPTYPANGQYYLLLNSFPQNSAYAPEGSGFFNHFTEGQNIFSYTLVREVADVKNDVYVFGQTLESGNSGSFIPLSKHEFTDNFVPFTDLTFTSFQPYWYGVLWPISNSPDSEASNKQIVLDYPRGYNIAHQQIGDPWPFLIYPLPELDAENGVNLGSSVISQFSNVALTDVINLQSWCNDVSGSGTACTPRQDGWEPPSIGETSYYWLPTGSTHESIADNISAGNWYAITLLLDLTQSNTYLNELNEPLLSTGSDRENYAVMLNNGDTLHITYANLYNALNGNSVLLNGSPYQSGAAYSPCEAIQINDYEQWWVILGSDNLTDTSGKPTNYFACAVEAPRLGYYYIGIGNIKDDFAVNIPYPNEHMTVDLPVGPEYEGVSSPNLRGQHSGSYKWTRVGNPDWYNITYAGVMYEFKAPDGSRLPTTNDLGYVYKAGGEAPYFIAYNFIMVENMYFTTSFQSHSFDTGSISSWGLRPAVFKDNRVVSNEMAKEEANAYIYRYRNPISQLDVVTYAQPYKLGQKYTINLESEPNLVGLPDDPTYFTMIEHEVSWSNSQLLSKCTLTNLPRMRYPTLFTNFHMQPTLFHKDFINFFMPMIAPSVHNLGPPKYNS